MNNAVAFSVDDNYMHYGVKLVDSLLEHDTDATIICRAICMSDENKKTLRDKNVKLIVDDVNLSAARTIFKKYHDPAEIYWTYKGDLHTNKGIENIRKTMYSPRAAYSCHSRFKTIIEVLPEHDMLLCLDADTIVKKCINRLFDKKQSDMYVVPYGENEHLFHNEGLLLINNTQNSIDFYNKIHDGIFTDDNYLEWDIDTEVLSRVYESHDIKIGKISKKYKDKKHADDAYMWSGDGPRKYKQTFTNEKN